MSSPPVALSIAGSDCSSGAGIQADLKTFQHHQVHGLTAVTCVVSETARTVAAVDPVDPAVVESQVALMLDQFPVQAVKTGMLHSAEVTRRVADLLNARPEIPLVVDPVMVATSGARLIECDAIDVYRERLFSRARLLTPNLAEAATLLGQDIHDLGQMEAAALELSARHGTAVLLKGGHLDGDQCVDLLAEGGTLRRFTARRIAIADSHGTGCTLSAAICAGLSHGLPLATAIEQAKAYLGTTLVHAYPLAPVGGVVVHYLNQGTCGEARAPGRDA